MVGHRWVYATKCDSDNRVTRLKARLVARGFSQQQGVDYNETFSAVLRHRTLRLVLALVAHFDLTLEFMDVVTAFLNAPLTEEVYMEIPEGFEGSSPRGSRHNASSPRLVWLLLRAIYGLKQASRQWNITLTQFIVQELGFIRLRSDSCVFVRRSKSGKFILIGTYVDDMPCAYAAADAAEWAQIKEAFARRFEIKFLGEGDSFLNMRITRDRVQGWLLLDQAAYTSHLLSDTPGFDECNSVPCPSSQEALSKKQCPSSKDSEEFREMAGVPYRSTVGALNFLASSTRPDIAFHVNRAAQFNENPGAEHWKAVKRILRYLAGTVDYGLLFTRSEQSTSFSATFPQLIAFADASWSSCADTGRSTTGWLLALGSGNWIDWSSKKQETVALSSCEAEYMAATEGTKAVMWAKHLLEELHWAASADSGGAATGSAVQQPQLFTPLLFSDNKSAIALAHNDTHHNRSKHIELRYHFIREQVAAKALRMEWCSAQQQLADLLTKPLTPLPFTTIRDQLVYSRAILLQQHA